ncbi:uncharacterized protein LOC121297476 [Polyodon spathula]|uniref:uncharacterized protein LOC121297476 n=1 Tax=Polyodon spathula TaxID=7913 RepID=UPI001B7E15C4|nr:uncharacterized protein LOC121297476 [Polyodon spathula]
MALNRRKRLKEEHATLIQGELLKMEEELQAEKGEGEPAGEIWRLQREREVLVLQLEVLRRENGEVERDLELMHRRCSEELDSHRAQSLQVFRAFRQVFEEQKDALDRRYRTLLGEAIQDAIYLSARNQQLEAENARLHGALAELRDALSMKPFAGGSQHCRRDTATT